MQRALKALDAGLRRRGVRGDVYVFGGAALVLAYGADRPTRDIDARFSPHGPVLEEAADVARRLGLPRSWLNDQATVYLSRRADLGAAPVYDGSHLRVQAASAQHLVAMKAMAGRDHDLADLGLLAEHLGLRAADQVLEVVRSFFPDDPLPPRNRLAIEDLFRDGETPAPAG